jgi:hypothetical protein
MVEAELPKRRRKRGRVARMRRKIARSVSPDL